MTLSGDGKSDTSVVRESLNAITVRDIIYSFVAAVGIAIVLKVFFLGMYAIPTSSMSPTLLAGDYVLVSKVAYSVGLPDYIPFTDIPVSHSVRYPFASIHKGDIIVFHFPYQDVHPSAPPYFIKRVAGVPHDTIAIHNGTVLFGEEALNSPRRRRVLHDDMPYIRPFVIPYKGMKLILHKETISLWKPLLTHEGNHVDVIRDSVFLNGRVATEYNIQENYYYVLGDNTADSFDSRYWGVVPERTVIGRPVMVYWSVESNGYSGTSRFRWNRIGTFIK
ncbi:MAG: signal peptidase I [Candidatus Kapabacteria bacterium]|nr:signal peptidase I [Candidatus Kapabacteria bacterium]